MQPKEEKKVEQPPVKTEPTEPPKVEEEVKKLTCGQKVKAKVSSVFSYDSLGKILKPIDFQSDLYLLWLSIVSLFYIYNIFAISIRFSFEFDRDAVTDEIVHLENEEIIENGTYLNFTMEFTNATIHNNSSSLVIRHKFSQFFKAIIEKRLYWFMFDYLSDLMYLVDIFLIQTRIKFLKEGLWISDLKSTSLNYFKSWKFYVIFIYLNKILFKLILK
jgi:hypothetical protein